MVWRQHKWTEIVLSNIDSNLIIIGIIFSTCFFTFPRLLGVILECPSMPQHVSVTSNINWQILFSDVRSMMRFHFFLRTHGRTDGRTNLLIKSPTQTLKKGNVIDELFIAVFISKFINLDQCLVDKLSCNSSSAWLRTLAPGSSIFIKILKLKTTTPHRLWRL